MLNLPGHITLSFHDNKLFNIAVMYILLMYSTEVTKVIRLQIANVHACLKMLVDPNEL